MTEIEAVVFDFDGLVLDTEAPVFQAWRELFERYGVAPLTVAEWAAEIGTAEGIDLVGVLRERSGRDLDMDARNQRRARRDELLALEAVRPGVESWIAEAEAHGLGVAVASSSPYEWVHGHLERLGLRDRFLHLACYSDTVRSKPEPDTYLAACAALGVQPRAALAVEDSPNGVVAAKAAGLAVVIVPHALTETLDLSAADLRLDSLAACTLADACAQLGRPLQARR